MGRRRRRGIVGWIQFLTELSWTGLDWLKVVEDVEDIEIGVGSRSRSRSKTKSKTKSKSKDRLSIEYKHKYHEQCSMFSSSEHRLVQFQASCVEVN